MPWIDSPFKCPHCGEEIVFCEVSGCTNVAEYEGWTGKELIRRRSVCEEHAPMLRGWIKHQQEGE